jgi:hypothetical protein
MSLICIHYVLALILCGHIWALERIRTVQVKRDEIVTIKTAINVATIIQVPDPPTSLVVGDSSAFKVEYLDQAITIKPLHRSAKTNLYIYTEFRRFDVSLVSVPESAADYVVYLKQFQDSKKEPSNIKWKTIGRSFNHDGLSFRVKRIGRAEKTGLVEFEVSSSSLKKIDPAIFWLTHRGKTYEIEKLVLSAVDIEPKSTVSGLISFKVGDLKPKDQLILEVRQNGKARLALPKIEEWK